MCGAVNFNVFLLTFLILFLTACSESNKVEIVRQGAALPLIQLARQSNPRAQRNASGSLLNLTHIGELQSSAQCLMIVKFMDVIDHGDHISSVIFSKPFCFDHVLRCMYVARRDYPKFGILSTTPYLQYMYCILC